MSAKDNLYERAGIADPSEFYRAKFVSDEVLDARYFKALDRFDIRFARTMWIYDNVRARSSVLDLGCGAGLVALLKRKDVTLTGIDLSAECALAARRNGYDFTTTGQLTGLPFPDHSFDYVVSLDVLGHIGRGRMYPDLIGHTVEMEIGGGLKIPVLDLETLIAVKEEVGGEKDLAVLPILRSVLKARSEQKSPHSN